MADNSVVQWWLSALPWKQQSILFSGLRGPDAPNCRAVKKVNRWMRTVTQHNADPSKDYMKVVEFVDKITDGAVSAWPDPLDVCSELEFLPCHYVHHFADALAVIAYGHPDREVATLAANLHYRIAEEIFHFVPEPASVFELRHRDKVGGEDADAPIWDRHVDWSQVSYMTAALSRFNGD